MPADTKKRRDAEDLKKRRDTPYTLGTSVVRLSHAVKQHIIKKGRMGESFDQTLRRLFKLKQWDGKEEEGKGRGRR